LGNPISICVENTRVRVAEHHLAIYPYLYIYH
jgi:hypothetical protein